MGGPKKTPNYSKLLQIRELSIVISVEIGRADKGGDDVRICTIWGGTDDSGGDVELAELR